MPASLRDRFSSLVRSFQSERDFRELLVGGMWSLIIRILGVSTGFFVTWITARYYGAEALGIVSICIGILSLTSVFARLGYDVALVRFISGFYRDRDLKSIRGIYTLAITRVIFLSLICSVLLFMAAPWMAGTYLGKSYLTPLLRLNAFLVVPLTVLQVNAECLRGVKRIRGYTFFQTAAISSFALVFLLIFLQGSSRKEVPVLIQFTTIIIAATLSFLGWSRSVGLFNGERKMTITPAELGNTAAPMLTTTIMQLVMSWSGTLTLAAFVDESTVGVYNALVRISVFTNITILAISGIVMTRFATSFTSGDFTGLKQQSSEATRLMLITSLPLFIGLFVFATPILNVFGPAFHGREKALFVLLGGQFTVVFSGLPSQLLNMTGSQRLMRSIAIGSAVINLMCCWILIPRWGIMGACYAALVGTLCWNILSIAGVYNRFGILTIDFWSKHTKKI